MIQGAGSSVRRAMDLQVCSGVFRAILRGESGERGSAQFALTNGLRATILLSWNRADAATSWDGIPGALRQSRGSTPQASRNAHPCARYNQPNRKDASLPQRRLLSESELRHLPRIFSDTPRSRLSSYIGSRADHSALRPLWSQPGD